MRTSEDVNLLELLNEELYERFQDERLRMRDEAKRQIQRVQEANCRNFNKKRKPATKNKVGDLVSITRTQ